MIIWISKRQFAIDFQRIGIFTGISIGFGTLRKLENCHFWPDLVPKNVLNIKEKQRKKIPNHSG